MGISDKVGDLKDTAVDKLGGSDNAKEQVDKGAEALNEKTGGKFDDQVEKGTAAAKEMIDKADQ